jgi:hypothetical protein
VLSVAGAAAGGAVVSVDGARPHLEPAGGHRRVRLGACAVASVLMNKLGREVTPAKDIWLGSVVCVCAAVGYMSLCSTTFHHAQLILTLSVPAHQTSPSAAAAAAVRA